MKYTNLDQFHKITPFIKHRLELLNKAEPTFSSLFELMFLSHNNVIYEESVSYKIKKTTYGESKERIKLIARNINEQFPNTEYNSVIGLYLDNGPIWIETFWAILMSGHRPLLLNMHLDIDVLNKTLDSLSAVGVISDTSKFKVKTIATNDLLVANDTEINNEFGTEMFVMSSGTSNSVKACAYGAEELKNILLQSEEIINSSKLIKKHYRGELKLLTLLPFYHIIGFIAIYTWFTFFSRTLVALKDMSPFTIQNTIRKHHVTHVFAIPLFFQKTYDTAIKKIKERGDKTYKKFLKGMKLAYKPVIGPLIRRKALKQVRDQMFGESVYFMISGGSVIDNKVLRFFNGIGYHLANGYGSSEIGITSVELSNNLEILTSGSIGKPLLGVEYHIDENHELSVRGKTTAKYIIENGQKTILRDTWYQTHDLFEYRNNRYYIHGREDDLVVSITGENLNPNIIENTLSIDGVELCLINGQNGELPLLLVNTRLDKEVTLSALKEKMNEHNLTQQIGKIVFVKEPLIKENEFKLNRKRIAKDYYENKIMVAKNNSSVSDSDDEIINEVKKVFAESLNKNIKDISLDGDFFLDLGGTSLDYFMVISQIEEIYNINISLSEKPLTNVNSIVEYIRNKQ